MSRRWLVHAIIGCTVCDAEWQDFTTAQEKAAAHARETGHYVRGEVGYAVEYGKQLATPATTEG